MITVPAPSPRTRQRLGRPDLLGLALSGMVGPVAVDGNTLRDRIPFDLTHDLTTTAHAAEESPG